MNEESQFEVTDHFELPERWGAFVIGHIRSGVFKTGLVVDAQEPECTFTISGIEFLDNISEKRFWNALHFQEKPEMETVRRCFPVGTVLKAVEKDSQQ